MSKVQLDLAYVIFKNPINDSTTKNLLSTLSELNNNNLISQIYLLFSSTGGDLANAIDIYYFLRSLPKNIIIHGISQIESVAIIIFLGSENRLVCRNTIFMFHDLSLNGQSIQYNKERLQIMCDILDSDKKRMINIFCNHIKISEKEAKELFSGEIYKDSEYAKEIGLVKEISDFKVSQSSKIYTVI